MNHTNLFYSSLFKKILAKVPLKLNQETVLKLFEIYRSTLGVLDCMVIPIEGPPQTRWKAMSEDDKQMFLNNIAFFNRVVVGESVDSGVKLRFISHKITLQEDETGDLQHVGLPEDRRILVTCEFEYQSTPIKETSILDLKTGKLELNGGISQACESMKFIYSTLLDSVYQKDLTRESEIKVVHDCIRRFDRLAPGAMRVFEESVLNTNVGIFVAQGKRTSLRFYVSSGQFSQVKQKADGTLEPNQALRGKLFDENDSNLLVSPFDITRKQRDSVYFRLSSSSPETDPRDQTKLVIDLSRYDDADLNLDTLHLKRDSVIDGLERLTLDDRRPPAAEPASKQLRLTDSDDEMSDSGA